MKGMKMMSRIAQAEINRLKVRSTVEKEFSHFRHKTFRHSKKRIFNSYNKIGFYSLVYSYFNHCNTISDEIIGRLAGNTLIIEELWRTMLTSVEFYINSWEDVTDLIWIYLDKTKIAVNY